MVFKTYKKVLQILIFTVICVIVIYIIVNTLKTREPYVNLVTQEQNTVIESSADRDLSSLRFAVATMWSVESTFSMYRRLVQRIGKDVGRKDSFILRPTYRALRKAIEQRDVDVAFVCTGPYVYALPSGRIKLLVQPEFVNGHLYHSVILVPAGSSVNSLEDLRGAVLGFSDPESFTGCMVPYLMMVERGLNPKTFFKKIIFTGSHDRTIHAVDRGIVSAAAVHSVVLESAKREDPSLMERLKVIWSSETFGPPPVIISNELDENFENSLREAFLKLGKDENGREILSAIGIDQFVPAREEDYQSAIEIYKRYKNLGEDNWP